MLAVEETQTTITTTLDGELSRARNCHVGHSEERTVDAVPTIQGGN
jgi:hypothetical protein